MSFHSNRILFLALAGAVFFSASAFARDLIVVDGPIKAKNVKCRGCVDARDIGAGAVTSGKIQTDAVTADKIRSGAVGATEMQDGAVTNPKIGAGAVGTANIQDKSITIEKLADGILDTGGIGPGTVGTVELQDGAVTSPKIGAGAVTTGKILNGAVTSPKIGAGAVGTTNIQDRSVTVEKLANGVLESIPIGPGSVGTDALQDGAVTEPKIAPDAVTTAKILDGTVTGNDIADGTITADKLAFGAGVNEIEPFRVLTTAGGLCDSGGTGTSNPEIEIDNTGVDEFVVTSILIKTSNVPVEGFVALSINSVEINNFLFDTRTDNLVGPTDGSGVLESADLMGTPVRRGPLGNPVGQGGNFPHQIVAGAFSDGPDIEVQLFCRSDFVNLSITAVAVSGWKFSDDDVTVTYRPGT